MQFSIITSILAAATAVSAAATPRDAVSPRAIDAASKSAEAGVKELEAQGCDVFGCVSAYAPTLGACAIALAEPTPAGEIACFLAIVNHAGNPVSPSGLYVSVIANNLAACLLRWLPVNVAL